MTHRTMQRWQQVLVGLLLLPLVSCGSGESGGGGTSTSTAVGTLTLSLTDAPVDDAARVVVQFTGIELQAASGARLRYDFDTPQQIDLLALRSGKREILFEQQLPVGSYTWVRLNVQAEAGVEDSFIELLDGTTASLRIPSGDQTRLLAAPMSPWSPEKKRPTISSPKAFAQIRLYHREP